MKKFNLQPGDLFSCVRNEAYYLVTYTDSKQVKFKNVRTEEKFNYATVDVERLFKDGDWTLVNEQLRSTVKPITKEAILDLISNTLFRGQDDSMTLDTQVNLIYTQWKTNLK